MNYTTYLKSFVDLIFPRNCWGCRSSLQVYEKHLCLRCQLDLPITNFHLTQYNPLYEKLYKTVPLKSASSLFYFHKEGIVSELIHQFKYLGQQKIGLYLGDWLGEVLRESPFLKDIKGVIPVPLHPTKQRKRGYNQAEILSMCLSKKLQIPLYNKSVERVKNTKALAHIGYEKRREEIHQAFEQKIKLKENEGHLLLVDDVITTGATISSCAQALLKNEGIELSVVSLACRV